MELKGLEKEIFEQLYSNLEDVTEKFTKEDSICFGTKSAGMGSRIVPVPENFSGFTVQPSKYLTQMLNNNYPTNGGMIVYYLMEDAVSYHKIRIPS